MPQCSEGALLQPGACGTSQKIPTKGKMMIQMASRTKKQTTSPHLQIGEFYTRILYRTCFKLYKSTYMYRKKKSQNVSNGWPKVVELWLNFKKSAS